MSQFNDVLIDFESVGFAPDGVLLDFAAIAFDPDPEQEFNFTELCQSAYYCKFDTETQTDRKIDERVVDFWTKQSEEAKIILDSSETDVSLVEGITGFINWYKNNKIDFYKSRIWSRGNEFDLGMFVNCLRGIVGDRDIENILPVAYWNVRDIRTAIEENVGRDNSKNVPLPKNALDGFIVHNSVHDCAKDIMLLQYSRKLVWGLYEPSDE